MKRSFLWFDDVPLKVLSVVTAVLLASLPACTTPSRQTTENDVSRPEPTASQALGVVGVPQSDAVLDNVKGFISQFHPTSAVYLGGGVNSLDETDVKDRPLLLSPLARVEQVPPRITDGAQIDTGVRKVDFSVQMVTSYRELYDAMNFSLRVEAKSFFAKGSVSTDVASSAKFNDETINLVVRGTCDFGRYALRDIELTPDAKRLSSNPRLFFARYGTHVAVMERRFAEVAAIVSMRASSREAANSLRVAVSGKANFLFAKGSLDSVFTKQHREMLKDCEMSVSFIGVGGDGFTKLAPIVEAFDVTTGSIDPSAFAAVRSAIEKYVEGIDASKAPAVEYYCLPLEALRQSDPIAQDFERIQAIQRRVSEGVVFLTRVARDGSPASPPPSPRYLDPTNGNELSEPSPGNADHEKMKEKYDSALKSHEKLVSAYRDRAEELLAFLARYYVLSRGEFDQPAEQSAESFHQMWTSSRDDSRLRSGAGEVNSKAISNSLFDEWKMWLSGFDFPLGSIAMHAKREVVVEEEAANALAESRAPSILAPTLLENAYIGFTRSCTCGKSFGNDCAHYLSNALIKAGASFAGEALEKCETGRPIRAKELRDWAKRQASAGPLEGHSQLIPKRPGYWFVYQERASDGQGHVNIHFEKADGTTDFRGTGDFPTWEKQTHYFW